MNGLVGLELAGTKALATLGVTTYVLGVAVATIANDFIVFATQGVASFASGAMVTAAGWEAMNRAVLPFLALIAAGVLWLAWRRRSQAPVAG